MDPQGAPSGRVLVLDLDGTGPRKGTSKWSQITQRNQIVFTDWDPTAKVLPEASEEPVSPEASKERLLQALRDVFDSDHNGVLDAADAQFAKFKILGHRLIKPHPNADCSQFY